MNLAQALMAAMSGGDLRLVTYTTANSSQITVPANGVAGDLLVLMDHAFNTSGTYPTSTTPSGFTSINSVTVTGAVQVYYHRQNLSYQLAATDLSGTVLTGMSGSGANQKILAVFRGNSAFSAATLFDADGQATNSAPATQTIACNGGTAPLIAIGAIYSGGTKAPLSSVITSGALVLSYKLFASNPSSDESVGCSDGGDANTLQSCYIQLTY